MNLIPRLITFLTIFVSILSFVFLDTGVDSAWQDKYNEQKNTISQQLSGLQSQMDTIASTIDQIAQNQEELTKQITDVQADIRKMEQLITDTKGLIVETELEIVMKKEKIAGLQNDMKKAIQEYQRNQDTGALQYILSSSNLSVFLSKLHDISTVSDKIDSIKTMVDEEKKKLEEDLASLEKSKKTLEAGQALNKSKKDGLTVLLQRAEIQKKQQENLQNNLTNQENKLESELSKLESEMAKKQAQIDACIANTNNYYDFESEQCLKKPTSGGNSGYTGGTTSGCVNEATDIAGISSGYFTEPAYGYMSQGFDCVPYLNGAHDGVDIANGLNTPIYAAADGIVTQAGVRGGYGNAILIKHSMNGRRLYTRYGHLNSLIVSVGQTVKKGQQIGYMGTTGYSTGVHLHFSISDETLEPTGNSNCNPNYGYTSTYCYNPFKYPFSLWN